MVGESEQRRRPRLEKDPKTQDITWVPPRKDDDAIHKRGSGDDKQEELSKHQQVLKSMDLIVDDEGFLVPRRNKIDKDVEDTTIPEEDSISVPYCKLMQDDSVRGGKSHGTMATEALTKESDFFASQTDLFEGDNLFVSPQPPTPTNFYIPADPNNMISPLPDNVRSPLPDPSLIRKGTNEKVKMVVKDRAKKDVKLGRHELNLGRHGSESSSEGGCRSSFFIPGITAKGRTLQDTVHSRDFTPKTLPSQKECNGQSSPATVDFAPLNRSTRLSAKSNRSPSKRNLNGRKSEDIKTGETHRRKSDLATTKSSSRFDEQEDTDNFFGHMEQRPPTPRRRKPRLSAQQLSPSLAFHSLSDPQPPKNPSTSHTTNSTAASTMATLSPLSNHFRASPKASRQKLLSPLGDLRIDLPCGNDVEDESYAGAVIVRTRKVPVRRSRRPFHLDDI